MINIKGIKRVVIAVSDLEIALEQYKKLFNIKPFASGTEEEKGFHWVAFELGNKDITMEFISPLNDPELNRSPIARFIKKHGEGIYMIDLETNDSFDATITAMQELGLNPTNRVVYEDMPLNSSGAIVENWQECFINPKITNGVLFALVSIENKDFGVRNCKGGRSIDISR